MDKGLELLADYIFYKNYSQPKENGELETWEESVERIYETNRLQLRKKGIFKGKIVELLNKAEELEKKKVFLSSQRARQFAEPNVATGVHKNNLAMYNCSFSLLDRVEFYKELMYLAISGTGTGYSVRKEFVDKLPEVKELKEINTIYTIEDSKEGWANAVDVLMHSILKSGLLPKFDYNAIRPKGSLIAGKWLAPGPEPLREAFNRVIDFVKDKAGRKLRPFEAHYIACVLVNAVITAGVRRSACIVLFDVDDEEMIKCKTGNWYNEYPELCRANNSICVAYGEDLSYLHMKKIFGYIKEFGEPGIVRVPNYEYGMNPCAEILIHAVYHNEDGTKSTGWGFCNLCEINADKITTKEEFFEACESASAVATVQATYTDFKILSDVAKKIAERDSAIGVSITGLYQNQLLSGKILEEGANRVVETNKKVAKILGIPVSKRSTTIKPSGNASAILGLACSGIHPAHSHRYLRRVRTTADSPEYIALKDTPLVKHTVSPFNEYIVSFPVNLPLTTITKENLAAVEHMKFVGMVKHFWVNKGMNPDEKNIYPNNVSATVEVSRDEWDEVAALMYANSHLFSGCSFLAKMEDHYPNLPYSRISNDEESKEFDDISKWLETNEINFRDILSSKKKTDASDMAAMACSGGSCELV